MIGYLSGDIIQILEKTLIIQTSGGVGYQVFPSGGLLATAQIDQPLSCYIYTRVTESELSLYGFTTLEERQVFEKLLSVSGIGPKIALQIVSGPVDQFFTAVEGGDDAFIAQTPGIGKKMAQKIIVELRGKLDLKNEGGGNSKSQAMQEAIEALEGLGYERNMVTKILKEASSDADAETLVKHFLQQNK